MIAFPGSASATTSEKEWIEESIHCMTYKLLWNTLFRTGLLSGIQLVIFLPGTASASTSEKVWLEGSAHYQTYRIVWIFAQIEVPLRNTSSGFPPGNALSIIIWDGMV